MNERNVIPLSVPSHIEHAVKRVSDTLTAGWVSSVGPQIEEFEKELANYLNVPFVSATNSGTAALHLALLAAGIGEGDAVIVPGLSFIASANPIRYAGAEPVFLDVDPDTWTLSVPGVREYLSSHCEKSGATLVSKQSGRRIAGIIAVDIFGVAAPLRELEALAKECKLTLIEDAAESLGSSLGGRKLGGFGDFAALSFNGNKIMTTGAGGAVISHSEEHAKRVLHLSTQAKQDPVAYEHDEIGFNYRMNNVSAALGLSQLEHLPEMLSTRRKIYERYEAGFKEAVSAGKLSLQAIPAACSPNHWLTCVTINDSSRSNPATETVASLREQGILVRPIWAPLFLQKPYINAERFGGEVAEEICKRGVCLPSSFSLSENEQGLVIEAMLALI